MNYQKELEGYTPKSEQEAGDKRIIQEYLQRFPDTVLTRQCELGHMTASSMIFNPGRDKVLMVFHNIYQSWSWTGGHADGETDLLEVALREAKEETGLTTLRVLTPEVFSVDLLPVWGHWKRGNYVSSHMHLNFSYLLEAQEDQALHIREEENSGVAWIPVEQLGEYVSEPDMMPVYEKLIKGVEIL